MWKKTGFVIFVLLILLALPVLSTNPSKSIILKFNIADNEITLLDSEIIYGKSPNHFVQWTDFKIRENSDANKILKEVGISDPREFEILDRIEGQPSYVMKKDVNFSVVMPFFDNAETIAVYDKNDKLVFEKNIGKEINEFCKSFPDDTACKKKTPLMIKILYVFLALVLLAVLFTALKRVHKKKNKHKRAIKKTNNKKPFKKT